MKISDVPVDSLLKRVAAVYSNIHKVSGLFVRLYSDSQVLAQYAVQDPVLQGEYLIDKLPWQEARRDSQRWAAFLQSHKGLMEEGFIDDEKQSRAYFWCASELAKIVTNKARVVFCTAAACRNRALRWTTTVGVAKNPLDRTNPRTTDTSLQHGTADAEYIKLETGQATTHTVDQAACANPLELFLPRTIPSTPNSMTAFLRFSAAWMTPIQCGCC